MNRSVIYSFLIVSSLSFSGVHARCDRKCESQKNKDAATKFCSNYTKIHQGSECKVDERVCPKGHIAEKKWKGKGINYSACIKGSKVKKAVQKVKEVVNSVRLAVNGYKIFFKIVDKNSSGKSKLPHWFIQKFQKFYKNNLKSVEVHESTKVVGSNAMTDCSKIYFPKGSILSALAGKQENFNKLRWLLHEVSHTEQCYKKGGRNNYAGMWFGNLPIGVLSAIGKADTDGDGAIDKYKDRLHDKMPMESDAEQKARELSKS